MWKTTNLIVLLFVLFIGPANILCTPRKSARIARQSDESKLIFSQVILRHGDRNPYKSYPNDLWKDEIHWPEGFGQLTKLGIQQVFQLGEYLRKRYESILPPNVYPNKIVHVQSTDTERTLMSAGSILAGLFPPTKEQVWNENINWQPVPVHTMPAHVDFILSTIIGKQCDRYDLLKKQHYNRPQYKAWHSKYNLVYERIKNETTISTEEPWDIIMLYDTLNIHRMKNKIIPDWATQIFDELKTVAKFEGFNMVGSREMSKISTGFLLREIIERFYKKINGSLKPNRNLFLYSAHDITITSIMNLLNILDSEHPPYAASLCLELYEINGQYFVQIVYKKSNELIEALEIPGCGKLCQLDQFHEIYKPFIPMNDFATECKLN